ncbi:hypothetical protein MDAP_000526 [Mitosporidium daphniae]
MPLPASNASLRGSPSTPNNPLYQPCISNGPLYEPSVSNNPLCGPASAAPQTATIGSVEYVIFGSGYESSFVNASAYCASLNESYPWNQGCQKSVQGSLADVNNTIFSELSSMIDDNVYINSWNGDTYNSSCLSLYPEGAIAVPIEGCNGPLGFICQINATAHQPRMADPSPMPMEYDEDEHSYY